MLEQFIQVERLGDHRELSLPRAWPFGFGAIPVELDAVAVGIAEVERLADAVVGGAFERNIRADEFGGGSRRRSSARVG